MNKFSARNLIKRNTTFAAAIYCVLLLSLAFVVFVALRDVGDRYQRRNASLEALDFLQAKRKRLPSHGALGSWSPGEVALTSKTVTLAGAVLLERVTGAIVKAGGSITSTEIEAQGSQPKNGYIKAVATCEVEQPAIQQMLYDIESGVPFLFVDQLVIQPASSVAGEGRMRVLLGVSALWTPTK